MSQRVLYSEVPLATHYETVSDRPCCNCGTREAGVPGIIPLMTRELEREEEEEEWVEPEG